MKKSCRRHLAMITLPIWQDFPLKTVLQVTALTLVASKGSPARIRVRERR